MYIQEKLSNQPPAGFLNSLPIQWHPWSHIVLNSKIGLPLSDRNIAIITVFDQFSKALQFIPFPKLPFAAVIGDQQQTLFHLCNDYMYLFRHFRLINVVKKEISVTECGWLLVPDILVWVV